MLLRNLTSQVCRKTEERKGENRIKREQKDGEKRREKETWTQQVRNVEQEGEVE